MCSNAIGVSALLVCMALHLQITRRHCSKFSVVPMPLNITKQQYSQPISRFRFTKAHWHVLGSIDIFMVDHQLSAVVNHAREHVNIPEYMEHFRAYIDLGNQVA